MLITFSQNRSWHIGLMLIVLTGLLWPGVAWQAGFVGCNPTPMPGGYPGIFDDCGFDDLLAVPVNVFNWILGMAGLLFIGVIIWGGARMMLFYASDAPETELANAKLTIRRGIFGFLIVALSYLIVYTLVHTIFGVAKTTGPVNTVRYWLELFGL